MVLDDQQQKQLRIAADLFGTARLAGISYLELAKRAREAIARAGELGCAEATIANALGVTRCHVHQLLEQEALKTELTDQQSDCLVVSFPPAPCAGADENSAERVGEVDDTTQTQ